VLGGNGYVEESGLPRLYREAPVYSIWEGSGNVMALDVLRALRREPQALEALAVELEPVRSDPRLAPAVEALLARAGAPLAEGELRRFCRALVVTLQAALLARHAPDFVADAFLASRMGEGAGAFGLLPEGLDLAAVVARAAPA
jgi:putative acyl-CoA dehydrogenase